MSSETTMERRTYWCHECDMSISLIPTTLTSCPHCTSHVLAELDSPFPFHTQNNNNNRDTNLIFDSPYFHHVINHLFNNNSHSHHDDHLTSGTTNELSALSEGDIESIKCVKITRELVENECVDVICGVCKEVFVIDDDVKELGCKHMYHPGCIIPWLLIRNSCPLCRFEMPVEERELKVRRRSASSVLRGDDFMDDDDGEEELFGFGLRHLAIRHRLIFPISRNDRLQQRQVEVDVDSERTENYVSGWPNWPVVDGGEINHQ